MKFIILFQEEEDSETIDIQGLNRQLQLALNEAEQGGSDLSTSITSSEHASKGYNESTQDLYKCQG